MRISRLIPVILVAACGLSACATKPRPVAVEADPVGLRLVEAADRAAGALRDLADAEQLTSSAAGPVPAVQAPPEELRQLVTVTWVGPVEPLASALARRAGYGFQTLGDAPPVPLIVDVNAIDMPMIELFRDLGLQAGFRADIAVDAGRRVVEVRYAPNDLR